MTERDHLRGNWNYPTTIRFGAGRIGELPAACRELGMANPLLVTDQGLVEQAIVTQAVVVCSDEGLDCGVYGKVQGNPVEDNIVSGVHSYREGGHDGIVAFGGGSALDAGKAIALMVGQDRPIWDFEDRDDWYLRVDTTGMAPVVAVPTTAGTGSEVSRSSVITDLRDHTKKIIFHPRMLPSIVLADPGLSAGLPAKITAAVGMDALSHNLEAFCSPLYHPLAQGIALEGMRLIKDWLPTAVADGANLEARAHMLIASSMGATAFQKGLGAMHAVSHPAGAVLGTHHGLTNAVVMPYVLEFNREAIDSRMIDLARYLDLETPSFEAVLAWVCSLRQQIGIPHTLEEIGVGEEYIERLAPMAAIDPSAATNPIPCTPQNLTELYRRCVRGTLDWANGL